MSQHLTLVVNEPDATERGLVLDPSIAAYRSTVVELPWPDLLGRRVLLCLDCSGRICDQCTASTEADVQYATDRMMGDLEARVPLGLVDADPPR